MVYAAGFLIALAIGITGIGGGTITVPVLLVFLHLAPDKTVGTALLFAAAVKLLVAPVYMAHRQVSYRALAMMAAGGFPGLIGGLWLLRRLHASNHTGLLILLIGLLIIATAVLSLFRMQRRREPKRERLGLLAWIMLPIGLEVGVSSAGAGAIGTLALLNLTRLEPTEVAGTNVLFGLILSIVGGGALMATGSYDPAILTQLIAGGIFGALLGPNLAVRVPAKGLRIALCLSLTMLGALLCWQSV